MTPKRIDIIWNILLLFMRHRSQWQSLVWAEVGHGPAPNIEKLQKYLQLILFFSSDPPDFSPYTYPKQNFFSLPLLWLTRPTYLISHNLHFQRPIVSCHSFRPRHLHLSRRRRPLRHSLLSLIQRWIKETLFLFDSAFPIQIEM